MRYRAGAEHLADKTMDEARRVRSEADFHDVSMRGVGAYMRQWPGPSEVVPDQETWKEVS
jgi:hypothetical protein